MISRVEAIPRRLRFALRVADRLWRAFAVIAFVLALAIPIATLVGFRFIVTSSVPKGLWFVRSGAAARGDYVFACLPASVARAGRRAGYLLAGPCPAHTVAVMKRLVAVPGDRVAFSADAVVVNGRAVDGTKRLRADSHGRPIAAIVAEGERIVSADAVWLLGDAYNSWDSRYFGAVPAKGIIGIGVPLIVTAAGP